jgi:hypothetical protein
MTLEPLPGDLRAFVEDPGTFVAIGPDEERILTDQYSVSFTPGDHFWSASVQRLRFGAGDVAGGVAEVRGLVADRGRNAAAWTVGPSATPAGLRELLVAMGMRSQSDEGSLILVLTEPPQAQAALFEVRLVTSYADHLAAIEVANQGFAFRARMRWISGDAPVPASSPSGPEGTASGCWRLTVAGRWRRDGRGSRRWACTWVAGRRSRRSVGGAP